MRRPKKIFHVENWEFEDLKAGKHACVDNVKTFKEFTVTNKETNETLLCKAFQIGGIATKDAAIRAVEFSGDYKATAPKPRNPKPLNKLNN